MERVRLAARVLIRRAGRGVASACLFGLLATLVWLAVRHWITLHFTVVYGLRALTIYSMTMGSPAVWLCVAYECDPVDSPGRLLALTVAPYFVYGGILGVLSRYEVRLDVRYAARVLRAFAWTFLVACASGFVVFALHE